MKSDTLIGGITFRYCDKVQESVVYSHKNGCLRWNSCEHSTGKYCSPTNIKDKKQNPYPKSWFDMYNIERQKYEDAKTRIAKVRDICRRINNNFTDNQLSIEFMKEDVNEILEALGVVSE
jgi:hypothetical protein